MKADDKVHFEDIEKPESFTNFEELKMMVEVLKEQVEEIVEILRFNDLSRKDEIVAPYFDADKVYSRLEHEK